MSIKLLTIMAMGTLWFRLGALIPRSVNLSVCPKLQENTKSYKTLQKVTKHQNKEFSAPFHL